MLTQRQRQERRGRAQHVLARIEGEAVPQCEVTSISVHDESVLEPDVGVDAEPDPAGRGCGDDRGEYPSFPHSRFS